MSALRKENGHNYEIVRNDAIPMPEGKLFDALGQTVRPATPGIMARLNEKSKDDITITKGMIAIAAIFFTALGLFLGYIVPNIREGGRESEKVVTIERDVKETRDDMKDLNDKFDKLNDRLLEQQRFIDRMGGLQTGVSLEGKK